VSVYLLYSSLTLSHQRGIAPKASQSTHPSLRTVKKIKTITFATMALTSVFRTLLIICTLVWATFAVPMTDESTNLAMSADGISPLPPSKDPFYTAPQGYKSSAPGAVLRVRSVPRFAKGIANCSAAYNILYRTTDSNYEPAWAATTLLVPQSTPSNFTSNGTIVSPGSILLSYQVSCKFGVLPLYYSIRS
jgi:hypothetical protein